VVSWNTLFSVIFSIPVSFGVFFLPLRAYSLPVRASSLLFRGSVLVSSSVVLVSSSVPIVSSSVVLVSSSVVENTCAMISGLASRAERRPLLSMWHAILVSSSTSKFDLLKSNEEATAGLENTSQWHPASLLERNAARYSRCDKDRAERRPLLSKWQTVRVSSSTSKFDLLKSNEEATAGLENTSQWYLASHLERNAARSARSDKNRAGRRTDPRSQFHSDYHLNFIVLDVTRTERDAART
jgi:hypothetical protein